MWSPTPIYERLPQVWFLLGLLFISTGLYLGFEFGLSFWYIAVGSFCCAFSVAIVALRFGERPKATADTRLSPDFVSDTPEPEMPEVSVSDDAPRVEQTVSE